VFLFYSIHLPGTSCQASRHFVPGYFQAVPPGRPFACVAKSDGPSGTGIVSYTKPGTLYLASIALSLRDELVPFSLSRHFMPGYYLTVPSSFVPPFHEKVRQ
jgi:hypothetical protein